MAFIMGGASPACVQEPSKQELPVAAMLGEPAIRIDVESENALRKMVIEGFIVMIIGWWTPAPLRRVFWPTWD
jgi:hypothetical protein